MPERDKEEGRVLSSKAIRVMNSLVEAYEDYDSYEYDYSLALDEISDAEDQVREAEYNLSNAQTELTSAQKNVEQEIKKIRQARTNIRKLANELITEIDKIQAPEVPKEKATKPKKVVHVDDMDALESRLA